MQNNLFRKGLIVGITLLCIGTSAASALNVITTESAKPLDRSNFLYVGGSGPGNYSHIQDAVDNASNGDTIFVYDDSSPYYGHLNIDKQVHLIGENRDTTIIDGNGDGNAINMTANGTTITGFTIQHGGNYYNQYAGLMIYHSSDAIITNNVFANSYNDIQLVASSHNTFDSNYITNTNYAGILLSSSSNNTMIHDLIPNNQKGVVLDHSHDNFIKNTVLEYNNIGVDIEYSTRTTLDRCVLAGQTGVAISYSENNTIINSLFSPGSASTPTAISLDHSKDNTISHNNISTYTVYGSGTGIDIRNSIRNLISENMIWHNREGIFLDNSSTNTFIRNNIFQNSLYGLRFYDNSIGNLVHHNNFFNNIQDITFDGAYINTFDDGYPSGGNYWGVYGGIDDYHGPNQNLPGSDGIGDYPYLISNSWCVDWYPLMHPFETYFILDILPENTTVNEGSPFIVTVYTMGGTSAQNATVEFNDELIQTDENGTAYFTAPLVNENTTFPITATKPGYTGDTASIIVKNIPNPLENTTALFWGRITNYTTQGTTISFNAEKLRMMTFSPFSSTKYTSGEHFTIAKDYKGLITKKFMFAICTAFA